MLIIFPWRVDVPQERFPVMNWLILLALVAVFAVQVADYAAYEGDPGQKDEAEPLVPGITGALMLDGWELKGLFGHMWLHGGLLHLIGNMWFLWLFGNAVCAKVGNLRYLVLYVLLGVSAGVTHLLFSSGSAVGASGAINGIVGMYLVLFFENNITCYFFFWFIYYFVLRRFTVSSCWMILFWFFWDVYGAFSLSADSNVGYFAHLGGFGAGFGIAFAMCKTGWITMEFYEKSLLQWWRERRRGKKDEPAGLADDRLSMELRVEEVQVAEAPREPPPEPKPIPYLRLEDGQPDLPPEGSLRVRCSCRKEIEVSRQYAGKIVQCPRCRERVQVPREGAQRPLGTPGSASPTAAPKKGPRLYIRFACPCGRKMKVPTRYAGRSGKCPQCGATVRVPEVS